MTSSAIVWLVIGLSFVAANLPFLTQRLLFVWPLADKSLWLRLFELLIMYLVVGLIALWFEHIEGRIYPQNWEFYAITGAMFLTFAFPGFVYRYLMRR
jgi:hypothetical protein